MKPPSTRAITSVMMLFFSALAVAVASGRALLNENARCSEGVVSRLYLGQATPAGAVTHPEWRAFVAASVSPRFPAGFTELRGDGRWRDDRGAVIEEHTRIIEIAHDGGPAVRERIRSIAADYRLRFEQESVLVTQVRTVYCFEGEAAPSARTSDGLRIRGPG